MAAKAMRYIRLHKLLAEAAPAQAATTTDARTIRRTLVAFTYRDFRVQWIGACTSSIGTWMQIVAQNWLIVSLTNADRKSTRLNSSHHIISHPLFSLKKKKTHNTLNPLPHP